MRKTKVIAVLVLIGALLGILALRFSKPDAEKDDTEIRMIYLTDIYVAIPEESEITTLSLYAEYGGTVDFLTNSRVNKKSDNRVHFAVSYHPETVYIIKGDGIEDYPLPLTEDNAPIHLYLDPSGTFIQE